MTTKPLPLNTRLISVLLSLPLLAVAASVLTPDFDVWAHLFATTLGLYVKTSLVLTAGVAIGTALVGGACALLCALYRFPGRNFFNWGLILPIALPVYITGYAYADMLSYGNWGYQSFHHVLGFVPAVRSLPGAVIVFTLALYPYVYLLVRSTLKQQSGHLVQASQALGLNPLQILARLILPMIRPAVIAACVLVAMETLSDYAAVQYFGVHTFSVGIFRTWFGLGSLGGAAQMSLLLLLFTLSLIVMEKRARKRLRYYNPGNAEMPIEKRSLSGGKAAAAAVTCAIPVLFGFVLPVAQLVGWVLRAPAAASYRHYPELVANTVVLGAGSAVAVTALAILLAYGGRFCRRTHWLTRVATSGYAVPGVIIAIGVLLIGSAIEKASAYLAQATGIASSGILVSGTLLVLYFAYTVRFMTLGFNAIENSLLKISPNLDLVSATLNVRGFKRVCKIHIPLMRSGVLVAALLVFVDVVKEVPATLVLRPFNFNTLAIHTYELASAERLSDMGLPALSIVLTSMLPLVFLWRKIRPANHARNGD